MQKTITPDEMKRLEENYMNRTGTSAFQLMERAARHVADAAAELAGENGGTVLCLCGPGSNGGDGLAAMRLLTASHPELRAVCWLLPGTLNDAAEHQLRRLQAEAPAVEVVRLTDGPLPPLPENVRCFVDSLFGTGLSRPLTGTALALCALMNEQERIPTLAVDIPSGLDGTTGRILGCAVRAERTVTFHRPKPGLFLGCGLDFAGKTDVVSIGIPPEEGTNAGYDILEPEDLRRLLPPRRYLSHKGTYGRVVLLAGSKGMAGAAAISATAALRAGAGLVMIACPESIWQILQTLCPCATCLPLPEDDPASAFRMLEKALNQADCLGMGCGLGQGPWARELVLRVLNELRQRQAVRPLPAVWDADALNLLAHSAEGYELTSCILTPHPAEAARLLHCEVSEVLADQETAARQLQRKYGASIVLKNAVSHLIAKEGEALNILGTPAMAKGGSGDALTGVLCALLAGRQAGAYDMNDLEVLQASCGLHGLAGLSAEARCGQLSVLATDLAGAVGMYP